MVPREIDVAWLIKGHLLNVNEELNFFFAIRMVNQWLEYV